MSALGIITGISYAGYLLIIRRGSNDLRRPPAPSPSRRPRRRSSRSSPASCSASSTRSRPGRRHGWLALVGITSQSIGYLIISISLPRLPAALTSIILLAQPVATVILARILLAEEPSIAQLVGVALVVGGIAVATVPVGRLRDKVTNRALGAPSP